MLPSIALTEARQPHQDGNKLCTSPLLKRGCVDTHTIPGGTTMQKSTRSTLRAAGCGIAALALSLAVTLPAQADTKGKSKKGNESTATLRVLATAVAQEAAQAAFETCSDQGYRVTAAVVGRDGSLLALVRNEQAMPASVDSATGKAYASVSFRSASGDLGQAAGNNPGLLQMPRFVVLRGGLPIAVGGEVVGGIGVGGAPGGDLDEVCAKAGIDRVADKL